MQTCSEIEAASETRDESVRCGLSFLMIEAACVLLLFSSVTFYTLLELSSSVFPQMRDLQNKHMLHVQV